MDDSPDKPGNEGDAKPEVDAKPGAVATPEAVAKPEPVGARDEAPESAKPKSERSGNREAHPESKQRTEPPPPLVHPPPGPPPAMPVRVLKSVATVVGIAAILALVTFVARVLARDSAPQSEEEPAGAQSATPNDEPLPVSTIPTPFGMDDFDARALFVADDDTVDASAQFGASLQTDGGRSDSGAPPRDGGPK